METLKKRYGLFTAICMVVGIVIGSGVFFKAQKVLNLTGGDALQGILAWLIGGAIMVTLAVAFAIMATKYVKVNGVVDYAEAICGKTYAYYIAWICTYIYYPAMTSVLAWVSARYTLIAVFGVENDWKYSFSAQCMIIAIAYLILIYFINTISPKLAGKFQVTTTVAKLVPLVFIALVGTIIGLVNGTLSGNFEVGSAVADAVGGGEGTGFFPAICATAFAYEGWIIATSINAEIKDAKKNLPIALLLGSIIIVVIYVAYYIGVLGLKTSGELMESGTHSAFEFFGPVVASIINILVIVSCLGTLNGLMLGCTRGAYTLAARNTGIAPKTFARIDKSTNMPHNSAALALLVCGFWLFYFVAANGPDELVLVEKIVDGKTVMVAPPGYEGFGFGWFGEYGFDSSELPIIMIYPLYIPILIGFMIKQKEENFFKRFIIPGLSVIGCIVMAAASIASHKMDNVWFLIFIIPIMALGAYFQIRKSKSALDVAGEIPEEE